MAATPKSRPVTTQRVSSPLWSVATEHNPAFSPSHRQSHILPPPTQCSTSKNVSSLSSGPPPLSPPPSPPSTASSPPPPSPSPLHPTTSPSRTTSSPPATSPQTKRSKPPNASPTSSPPPTQTLSSPSSPGSAATAVAADPRLLCATVDKTLNPRAAELRDLGLSPAQIALLIPRARNSFRSCSLGRNLRFWLPFFGSFDKLLQALQNNSGLLGSDLEKVIQPNIALLKQCGLTVCDVAKLVVNAPRVLIMNRKHVLDTVERVHELGVPCSSQMFGHALKAVAFISQEKVDMKMEILKTLGWSQADVNMVVIKSPYILGLSEEKLRRAMEFLKGEVGLEIQYIARRPSLLMYILERRLVPRHYALKVLKAKGLLDADLNFYGAASLTEKKFLYKFVHPYKESVPGLADAYASACAGKVPIGVVL